MGARTWLDAMVYRFQHSWETNPQFRAAATGAIGLLIVIAMCSCMGVTGVVANNVLASVGAGSGGSYSLETGTGKLAAPTAFPTYTLAPYNPGVPPAPSPIPNSATPEPSPTLPPTPTPLPTTSCQPNCGGGGGNGHGTVTASTDAGPWSAGSTLHLYIHTSAPNIGIAIILNLPGYTQTIEPAGQTDGSGSFTFSYPLPPGTVTSGQGHAIIMAAFSPVAYADVYHTCT